MYATRVEAKEAGWYSRRHRYDQAHQEARERYGTRAQRKRRRQERALKQRRAEVTRYMLGHFHPFENRPESVQQRKLSRAETDISNLEAKLA